MELLHLAQKIQSEVQGQLSQSQREFYLREQLKAIQKELGEGDEKEQEAEEFRRKIEEAGMPEEVKQEASRSCTASPHHSHVPRTYRCPHNLEWLSLCPGAFPPAKPSTCSAPPKFSTKTITISKR